MSDLRVGIFGAGALGRHHIRLLGSIAGVERVGVHDARPEVALAVAGEHGAAVFDSFEELAGSIDAAVVGPSVITAPGTNREWSSRYAVSQWDASICFQSVCHIEFECSRSKRT